MNKTLLITGASSGIGKALAIAYAAPGNTLLLTGRNATRLEKTAQQCQNSGARVRQGLIDVTDKTAMHNWIADQDESTKIDIVIANAGCSSTQIEDSYTMEHDIESAMAHVHFQGTLNTIHPILPRMLKRGSGQIAIMSSMNAFFPLARSKIYGSQKAALYYYGLSSRAGYSQQNIKFNVICPGWVDSALTQLNTFPMPWKMPVDKAALIIKKGLEKNKSVIAFPWQLNCLRHAYHFLPMSIKQLIAGRC